MKTKTRIITTAIALFNEKSSSSVSTNHIAAAAGISPGNLYYHFRNKEEIIRAIFSCMTEKMDDVWQFTSSTSPDLSAFFTALEKVQIMLWEYRFFQRELSHLLSQDKELSTRYKVIRQKRFHTMECFFEALIEAGAMRCPANKKTLSRIIQAGWIIGDYWLHFLDIEERPMTQESIREGTAVILEILTPYINDKKAYNL